MAHRMWTSHELELLQNLYKQGLCASKISHYLVRSVSSVNHKLDRLGRDVIKEEGRAKRTKSIAPSQPMAKKILAHQKILNQQTQRKNRAIQAINHRRNQRERMRPYTYIDMAQLIFLAQHKYGIAIKPIKTVPGRQRTYSWVNSSLTHSNTHPSFENDYLSSAQVLVRFNKLRLNHNEPPFHVEDVTIG